MPILPAILLIACNGASDEGASASARDPGTVTLHRLNRAEYNNTVRDLLGTSLTPADDFPYDDHGHGFDNMADVLAVSPLLVELYEWAADELVTEALEIPRTEPWAWAWEGEDEDALDHSTGGSSTGAWNLWSEGSITAAVYVEADGIYTMSARAWGDQAGDEPAEMSFAVDGIGSAWFDVPETAGAPGEFSAEIELAAGYRTIGVSFTNDYYDADAGEDRNLYVDWIALEGPADLGAPINPIRDALLTCEPAAAEPLECAREILAPLAERAWRRPLEDGELEGLIDFVRDELNAGEPFDDGLALAMKAILLSPHFLFRVELDPDPADETPRPLGAYELANRLSYFLWSSMPDDELFAAAADGSLLEDGGIEAQVRRMLADPKAEALVENFAGQWLYVRAVDDAIPDAVTWPDFDQELRDAMREQMTHEARRFLQEDRDMRGLLTGSEVWVDERLAAHYGLQAPTEAGFVDGAAAGRGGVLSQGGLLTALSHPTRTSPVKRGQWVLEQLLCDGLADPPPDIPALSDAGDTGLSLREQMELHSADPGCAVCHEVMDPIGFGMEHFDGIGAWREVDEVGDPIDAWGELPDGTGFYGVAELQAVLAADGRLASCMARQLTTYALGRGVEEGDGAAMAGIEAAFQSGGWRFSELAVAVATSEPFRCRRGSTDLPGAGEER